MSSFFYKDPWNVKRSFQEVFVCTKVSTQSTNKVCGSLILKICTTAVLVLHFKQKAIE